jgi:hypothetical protein
MKRYKIQQLSALEREMRAVARGERSPRDTRQRKRVLAMRNPSNGPR